MKLDIGHFKKVQESDHSAVLQHPEGHHIVISKKVLSKKLKDQLGKLPMMADGGEVDQPNSSPLEVEEIPQGESVASNATPMEAQPGVQGSFSPAADQGKPLEIEHIPEANAQTPAVASPGATVPGAIPQGSMESAISGYKQGLTGMADAQAQQGKSEAAASQKMVDDTIQNQANYKKESAALMQHIGDLEKDINSNHFDANRYINSMTDGKKVSTAIGLILGGIGSAFTGQENPAAKFLHQQIENDLKSQEMDFGKKKTLLEANYRQLGNMRDAQSMTQAMTATIFSAQMKKAAALSSDPMAKARLMAEANKFDMDFAIPRLNDIAVRRSLEQGAQQGTVDPAQYVRYVVPAEHQKEVFGEIERAQDTRKMKTSIDQAFEQAAKENTVMRTGAGLLRTPGSVYALHQAMQPTFKDLEGTVRQAAMDNTFKNITPAPGDSEYTIKQKRLAKDNYLESKMSAPTAKGFGIDLSKFNSTRTTHTNPPVERVTSDGKISLFDPDTKKFLGYK